MHDPGFKSAGRRMLGGAAALAAALWFVLSAGVGRADVVRILNDDRAAAQARVDLIQQARHEIDAAYFRVSNDRLALALAALLRDAAQRGVKVRLVVDGLNNHLPESVQAYLAREGVEIREYRPVNLLRPMATNQRMHGKLLVADARQMIVGARNLDHRNFGLAERNYVDCDAYVCGGAAADAHRYFDELWSSVDVRPVAPSPRPAAEALGVRPAGFMVRSSGIQSSRAALDGAMNDLCRRGFVRSDTGANWALAQPERAQVRFLSDCGNSKQSPGAMSDAILQLFAGAREAIVFTTPYLVLSDEFESVLADARARGVRIVILTNSLTSTDQILAYGGYANQRDKLLERGIELWEFTGPDHFHAKSAVIDGRVAIIGSTNFDPRSERINTETAIVAHDPDTAADLLAAMNAHFARSRPVGPDGAVNDSKGQPPAVARSTAAKLLGARLAATLIKKQL